MPAFAAPVRPATTPSGSLGMLVGAGGMHAGPLPVEAACLFVDAVDVAAGVLDESSLPPHAATTSARTATPMGRLLLQLRTSLLLVPRDPVRRNARGRSARERRG